MLLLVGLRIRLFGDFVCFAALCCFLLVAIVMFVCFGCLSCLLFALVWLPELLVYFWLWVFWCYVVVCCLFVVCGCFMWCCMVYCAVSCVFLRCCFVFGIVLRLGFSVDGGLFGC